LSWYNHPLLKKKKKKPKRKKRITEREREKLLVKQEAAPGFLSKNLSTFLSSLPLSHFHSISICKSWVSITFPRRKERLDLFGCGMCG
jgi:hypothetical protein